MTQLTKEHFDAQLKKLATKEDLKSEIAQLAGMVQRRFDDVEQKLDVRVRVEKNERDIRVIKQALHLPKSLLSKLAGRSRDGC